MVTNKYYKFKLYFIYKINKNIYKKKKRVKMDSWVCTEHSAHGFHNVIVWMELLRTWLMGPRSQTKMADVAFNYFNFIVKQKYLIMCFLMNHSFWGSTRKHWEIKVSKKNQSKELLKCDWIESWQAHVPLRFFIIINLQFLNIITRQISTK